ncbi:hypothetical protein [Rhodonellum sp.]|nr:hypothetical protein [Rhodonellum sp.]MDO9554512.1 hypothetical protein [Rhodonellum sp.]
MGGDRIISVVLNVRYADVPYAGIMDSVQIHLAVPELIPTWLEGLVMAR